MRVSGYERSSTEVWLIKHTHAYMHMYTRTDLRTHTYTHRTTHRTTHTHTHTHTRARCTLALRRGQLLRPAVTPDRESHSGRGSVPWYLWRARPLPEPWQPTLNGPPRVENIPEGGIMTPLTAGGSVIRLGFRVET